LRREKIARRTAAGAALIAAPRALSPAWRWIELPEMPFCVGFAAG